MTRGLVACALALLFAASARAEGARVARSELRGGEEAGLVFFLAAAGKAGAVAVGAAHSFDRTRLAEVGEVAFLPPQGTEALALSRRYFARPGRPFHLPGSSLRDDFLIFALEGPPEGVRVLEPAPELPAPGARVFVLGLRAGPARSEATLPGTVVESTARAIEVDLDGPADLRGWGGAPVLAADGEQVIGLLQAARPKGARIRASVGPIAGVGDALAEPYERGLGRLFATLAPQASAANSPRFRRGAAAGTPLGDLSPDTTAQRLDAALAETSAPASDAPGGVRIAIDSPEPEAIFGDAAGAFLAGSALAERSGSGRFDLVVVIDTSESARLPSGVDLDGNGDLGDPADSILAAEVAAARQVLDGLDPKRTRVGVVTFAGEAVIQSVSDLARPPVRRAALTQEPLTSDYRRVRDALGELAKSLPYGMTHMAAGIDLATLELLGLAGSASSPDPESAKLILLFTDGQPTLPYLASEWGNVGAVELAADRARRAGVRIHSFAIGPEALEGPIAAVEMAAITRGLFTPVRDPGRLSEFVDAMQLAEVAEVVVRNATSGEAAHEVRLHADGSFEALVPLQVGKNLLEVRARTGRGDEARATRLVHYAPGSARAALPAELLGKYNRLLQGRLLELGVQQREAIRRELLLEIERERASALERAAAQRKELELRALPPSAP